MHGSLAENRSRGRHQPEFELLDTGIFEENRYFDVFVEYAKAGAERHLLAGHGFNRGPDAATLHLLPQSWFRNTWSWRPSARRRAEVSDGSVKTRARGTWTGRIYPARRAQARCSSRKRNKSPRLFGVEGRRIFQGRFS